MLFKTKKVDKSVYLLIPLIIATLCFFVIYASSIANYYDNYENIISNTYPDYIIIKENSSVYQNPNYSKDNINNLFSLEMYEYIGYLESEITVGHYNQSKFAIVWAPSSYYFNCVNVTLSTGEFLIDNSLRDEYFNYSSLITLQFNLNDGFETNETLTLVNFVQSDEIFFSTSLYDILISELDPDLNYIFMNDETFENLFTEVLDEVSTYNLYLFQFKRNEIYSTGVTEITNLLRTKENQLNSYYGIQYIKYEYMFQQELLREKLVSFENEISIFNGIQLSLLFLIGGGIIFSLIYLTAQTFLLKQEDRINLFRARGGKKSEIYSILIRNEVKLLLFTYLSSLPVSLLILYLLVPSYLKFLTNYLILAGTQLLIVILCGAIQIIILLRSLRTKRDNIHIEKTIFDKVTIILKEIAFVSITFAILLTVFLLPTAVLWEYENNLNYLTIFLYFPILVLVTYLSTKMFIIKFGASISFLLAKESILLGYIKQNTKKILFKRKLIFKLIIIFTLIVSVSLTVIDSYKNYLTKSDQFNQIADITIVYPSSSSFVVENSLRNFVNESIEIVHFESNQAIQTIYGLKTRIDGFCINTTKLDDLFENKKFEDSYTGTKNIEEAKESFDSENNSIIISGGVRAITNKEIGDNISFYWDETDTYYNKQIIDYVETIPIFSWFTKFFYSGNRQSSSLQFLILKSNFEKNLLETKNLDIISTISINDANTKETIIKQINELNSEQHLGIEIIDFSKIKFADEDYQIFVIKPEFLLVLLVLIGISLFVVVFDI